MTILTQADLYIRLFNFLFCIVKQVNNNTNLLSITLNRLNGLEIEDTQFHFTSLKNDKKQKM